MKAIRNPYLLILLLCILFSLTACGKERKAAYDIVPGYEALIFPESGEYLLGAQYHKGEAIQITGNRTGEVFLCKEGKDAEIFMTSVSEELVSITSRWWLSSDGSVYVLSEDTLTALSADGTVLYSVQADGTVTDICESTSGEIVLTISNPQNYLSGLAVLDTEGRSVGDITWLQTILYKIETGQEKDLLILDASGLYEYGLSNGQKNYYMEWNHTAYTPESVWDIRFLSSMQTVLFTRENMEVTLSKIDPQESGKTILTLKAAGIPTEVQALIVRFNQENPDYYIQVETRPKDVPYDVFVEKVQIEIATGHGADIVDGSSVQNTQALIEVGALEELSGWLEQEEIDREDYFPQAFHMFGQEEGVYGIPYTLSASAFCVDGTVFPTDREWNIENLLQVLEEYPEDKTLFYNEDATEVLDFFLAGSEDLNGLLDWETGTCDFSQERWRRMLILAARYGVKEGQSRTGNIADPANIFSYMYFAGYDNMIRNSGRLLVGYPTEEGMLFQVRPMGYAMNAASEHKEGVWQFLCYLLQEEFQYKVGTRDFMASYPVHRNAFLAAGEYFRDNGKENAFSATLSNTDSLVIGAEELTEEQLKRLGEILESGGQIPWQTKEIRRIISEECAAYFDGSKSMEEVSEVIQNRVQLYLNELTL